MTGAVEAAFQAARSSVLARALLTFFAIFTIFRSVVAVLWFGSRDVLSGVMSPGTLGQFLLYSVFCGRRSWRAVRGLGRTQPGGGAAERLTELLAEMPAVSKPAPPDHCRQSRSARSSSANVSFTYPSRPDLPALHNLSFSRETG